MCERSQLSLSFEQHLIIGRLVHDLSARLDQSSARVSQTKYLVTKSECVRVSLALLSEITLAAKLERSAETGHIYSETITLNICLQYQSWCIIY